MLQIVSGAFLVLVPYLSSTVIIDMLPHMQLILSKFHLLVDKSTAPRLKRAGPKSDSDFESLDDNGCLGDVVPWSVLRHGDMQYQVWDVKLR
ncbi:hypothetical protein K469DRAFT_701490 [Zopfia rhizophila CBS 207.26]|uniref:Uncharacterized protein n=1 Tax=Zopfia rhizophila CBS 207.26 TaxID=1314779 RepID=A0A6A6DDV0_9PEZI|nr:hypothetical protein K469DRAFT_701490 [Zopfia rhizophila CBS 207.26]